ncbi:MAG: polysaccharide deacetylase family protein [Bacillota bacterium]
MAEVEEREEQQQLDPIDRKVPFYLRIELYLPLILVGGIILAIIVYARAMYGAGWTLGAEKQLSVVGAFVDETPPSLILYTSPTSKAFQAKVGANHDVLVKQWRDYFAAYKHVFREVSDPAELAKLENAVVILPSAVALNDVERKALTELHRKGVGILATNAFGARDGAGNWTGWTLMEDLFGTQVVDEVEANSDKNFLVTAANTPVTVAVPAGTRFWVGKTPEGRLRFEGGQVAARFLDWARTPDGKGGSIVYGEKSGGRFVLFGFSENAWEGAPTPIRTLADGALEFLQRKPRAVLSDWPRGFQAAHIASMNVEEQPENALAFAATLEQLNMRGTFFGVAEAVEKSPATFITLAAHHEIAYNGDMAMNFKGAPEVEQKRRIAVMQQKFAAALHLKEPILGFRAPGESYDAKTEQALQSQGVRYDAVDPARTDARLPIMAHVNRASYAEDLVVLPRTQGDDILYLNRPQVDVGEMLSTMRGELNLAIEEGALGMLSVHSRNYAKDGPMAQSVSSYLLSLAEQRNRVWLATGTEVSEWWRNRENVRVTLNPLGKRYELEVSNTGDATVEGATAIVYQPRASTVVVTPTKAWQPDVSVRRIDATSSAVIFGPIARGHYAYKLVFE